jgi:hypothetical protein
VRLILLGDLSTMKQQSSSIPVVEKYQNFNVCTGTGAIRTDLRSVKNGDGRTVGFWLDRSCTGNKNKKSPACIFGNLSIEKTEKFGLFSQFYATEISKTDNLACF